MRLLLENSDTFGALASFLCLIHCIVTPFAIIALQAYGVNGYEINPFWWQNLDFILLMISLISVAYSAKNSGKRFVKVALWSCWAILSILILNEKFHLLSFPEIGTYISSLSLAGFHVYNLKYCQCASCKCTGKEYDRAVIKKDFDTGIKNFSD